MAKRDHPTHLNSVARWLSAGRSPEELAQEFEPTAQSIRNWVGQAECDVGRGGNGLTTAEREELNQLRRENRPNTVQEALAGCRAGVDRLPRRM
jgi:transposase-like protein